MFKRNRFAAVMAIVVAIVVANTANARPGGSFRSGFSSSRPAATRSTSAPRQPSFGSFGQRQSQPPAAARTQRDSAMSRDLDRKAAQDQAMRTYDARTGASTPAGGGLPPLKPVLPAGTGGGNYGGGAYSGGAYAQHGAPAGGATSAPAPVIVREGNNNWLWGIGGFMLGRTASSHAAPAPVIVQNAPVPTVQQADVSGNSGALADAAGANDIATAGGANAAQVQATAAKPAAHQSSTLAKLAVALLIGGLVWLAWKAFRLMATAQAVKRNANYSFERN